MRRLGLGWAAVLLFAACTQQPPAAEPASPPGTESSGSTGGVTSVALHGEVVVAHPPGRQDAIKEVQRVAAERCPEGYLLRSLTTRAPEADRLTGNFLIYEAVIDCGGQISGYGAPR